MAAIHDVNKKEHVLLLSLVEFSQELKVALPIRIGITSDKLQLLIERLQRGDAWESILKDEEFSELIDLLNYLLRDLSSQCDKIRGLFAQTLRNDGWTIPRIARKLRISQHQIMYQLSKKGRSVAS